MQTHTFSTPFFHTFQNLPTACQTLDDQTLDDHLRPANTPHSKTTITITIITIMASPSTVAYLAENTTDTKNTKDEAKPTFGTPKKTPTTVKKSKTDEEKKSKTDEEKKKKKKTSSKSSSTSGRSSSKSGRSSSSESPKRPEPPKRKFGSLGGDTTGAFKEALRMIPSSPSFLPVKQCLRNGLTLAVEARVQALKTQLKRAKNLLESLGDNNNNKNSSRSKSSKQKDNDDSPAKRVKHTKGNKEDNEESGTPKKKRSRSAMASLTRSARPLLKSLRDQHGLLPGTFIIPESARGVNSKVDHIAKQLEGCFEKQYGKKASPTPSPTVTSESTTVPNTPLCTPSTPSSVTETM